MRNRLLTFLSLFFLLINLSEHFRARKRSLRTAFVRVSQKVQNEDQTSRWHVEDRRVTILMSVTRSDAITTLPPKSQIAENTVRRVNITAYARCPTSLCHYSNSVRLIRTICGLISFRNSPRHFIRSFQLAKYNEITISNYFSGSGGRSYKISRRSSRV